MTQDKRDPVRVVDATLDELAEAIAAGVTSACAGLFADGEAFKALRASMEAADVDPA